MHQTTWSSEFLQCLGFWPWYFFVYHFLQTLQLLRKHSFVLQLLLAVSTITCLENDFSALPFHFRFISIIFNINFLPSTTYFTHIVYTEGSITNSMSTNSDRVISSMCFECEATILVADDRYGRWYYRIIFLKSHTIVSSNT